MRQGWVTGCLLVFSIGFGHGALAQTPAQQWANCTTSNNPDLRINGCSAVILLWQGNQDTQEKLAAAFGSRGLGYDAKGQYDRAIADYDQAIRLHPNDAFKEAFDAFVLNGRCWARAVLGRLQPALADCNESLRLKPNIANTLNSRGLVWLKLGRPVEAIADYTAALGLNPKVAGSLYGRGIAFRVQKDMASAARDIEAAKQIEPNVANRYRGYGVPDR